MKKIVSVFLAFHLLLATPIWASAEDQPLPQEEEPAPDPDPNPEPDPPLDLPPEPDPEEEEKPEIDPFSVRLNEILPDSVESDTEGEFIELYNSGEVPIDLTGWKLDDALLDDNYAYTFNHPQLDYVMQPKSYLVFFRPETKLTLNNDTDSVYLFNEEMDEIDAFTFDSSSVGRSWGREVENPEAWILLPNPSPEAENIFENNPPTADIHVQGGTGGMKLNVTAEESSDPDGDKLSFSWEFEPGKFSDLENPSTYTFQSSGNKSVKLTVTDEFGLSDEAFLPFVAVQEGEEEPDSDPPSEDEPEPATEDEDEPDINYPKLTLINEFLPDPAGADGEGEWVELYNDSDKTIDLSGWHLDDEEGATPPFKLPENTQLSPKSYLLFQGPPLNLSLKNSEDVVRLLDPSKKESERIPYKDSKEGLSYAKNQQKTFAWTSVLTPKAQNNFPPPPKAYTKGIIKFESVLANPKGTDTGAEKILLKNLSSEPIDLLNWTLATSSTEHILPSISLSANAKKELTSTDFKLSLKNTEEALKLLDPTGQIIDEITWKTAGEDQWLFNTNSLQNGMMVTVNEVIDGDTFKMNFETKTFTVRLLGVDTPETVHPFKPVEEYGKLASEHLKNLLNGKQVKLNFDQNKVDSYGRILAYVYLDDAFVNAEVIKEGYGYAYTRFPFQFLQDFVTYQEEAKQAARGLWANAEVASEIEKTIQTQIDESLETEPEALVSMSETGEIVVTLEEASQEVQEDEEQAELNSEISGSTQDCNSEFLKIDSFVPSPKKGELEYVQLINTGAESICLTGWQLDDVLEGGSKPFTIKEGQLEPGKTARFDKELTKLAFNTADDCAVLISPEGDKKDEICYKTSHENEIFTHDGGDWVSAKTSKTTEKTSGSSSKSSTAKSGSPTDLTKHAFNRESSSYSSELTNRSFMARILGFDEEEKVMIVELEDKKIIPISFAHSLIDPKMLQELLDLKKLLKFDVYQGGEMAQLISVYDPDNLRASAVEKSSLFYLFFILPTIASGILLWKKREFLKNLLHLKPKIDQLT